MLVLCGTVSLAAVSPLAAAPSAAASAAISRPFAFSPWPQLSLTQLELVRPDHCHRACGVAQLWGSASATKFCLSLLTRRPPCETVLFQEMPSFEQTALVQQQCRCLDDHRRLAVRRFCSSAATHPTDSGSPAECYPRRPARLSRGSVRLELLRPVHFLQAHGHRGRLSRVVAARGRAVDIV